MQSYIPPDRQSMTSEERHDADELLKEWMKSEFNHVHKRLDKAETQHGEQQIAMANLDRKVTAALGRLDTHDAWHGKNDEEIALRLGVIEDADHDEEVRQDTLDEIASRFNWVKEVAKDVLKAGAGALVAVLLLYLRRQVL